MVHFASHCGVTNAVYYSSQSPSAFSTPQHRSAGSIHLDLEEGRVPIPGLPLWELDPTRPVREETYGAVARVEYGPGPGDWVALFFTKSAIVRNFFIAVFPAPQYQVRSNFRPPFGTLEPRRGLREQPTSQFYVFFGCPICGEYQPGAAAWRGALPPFGHPRRAWGVPPLPGGPVKDWGDRPPIMFGPQLRLDAGIGNTIWGCANGAGCTPLSLHHVGQSYAERTVPEGHLRPRLRLLEFLAGYFRVGVGDLAPARPVGRSALGEFVDEFAAVRARREEGEDAVPPAPNPTRADTPPTEVDENLPPAEDGGEAAAGPDPVPTASPWVSATFPPTSGAATEDMKPANLGTAGRGDAHLNLLAEVTARRLAIRNTTPGPSRSADERQLPRTPPSPEDLLTGPCDSAEQAELERLLAMVDPESKTETEVPASDSPEIDPFLQLVNSVVELERI
ncbi:hypothetical protein F5888DRAFT_1640096 [Russula emetica]|nr:hypothetical protein F5888DRAFT_1640096 [Russula emetica]